MLSGVEKGAVIAGDLFRRDRLVNGAYECLC